MALGNIGNFLLKSATFLGLARLIDKKYGNKRIYTKILPLKNNLFRVVFRITPETMEQSEQIVQEALLRFGKTGIAGLSLRTPSYCMMVARNLALRKRIPEIRKGWSGMR